MKRWPLHKAYFWERAPFFKLLLPLVAGILLYPLWKGSNTVALFTSIFAYLLLIATAARKTHSSTRRFVSFFSLHTLFIFLAFSLCYVTDVRSQKDWFGNHVNTGDLFLVRVQADPIEKETTWKLEVEVIETLLPQQAVPSVGEAFVYVYKDKHLPLLRKGDTLLLPNKWRPIQNAGNPFEFDYAAYCAQNNVHYQQFAGVKDVLLRGRTKPEDLTYAESAHDQGMKILERYVKDKRALGLVQSMLIGDKANLDTDTRQAFAETGIVHVIAISGAHIAVLFVVIMFLLRWVRHKKYLWLKYAVAVPIVWFYVLVAGGPPSAVRAALMFTLLAVGFALRKRRDTNSLNHLFATAFILLVAQPMWLYSIGFQLSFIAVLSLVLFYRHIYRWYLPVNSVAKFIWSAIAASISAEILIAPLIVYYFHTFPLLFIISNVVACVLMGLVLILGMSVIGFSFVPAFAKLLGVLVVWIVCIFNYLIESLRGLGPERLRTLRLDGMGLLLVYLLIASIAVYLLQKRRQALLVGLIAACLLVGTFCINHYRDIRQQRLVVYSIGKGYFVEKISGNTFSVIATDTVGALKKDYVVTPAHIGWQSLTEGETGKGILSIRWQTVIVLTEPLLPGPAAKQADVVVICYAAKLEQLKLIYEAFHPATIVMSYTMPGNALDDWVVLAAQMGVNLHAARDGAFIVE